MNHAFQQWLFCGLYFGVSALFGVFFFGPVVFAKIPDKRIKEIILIWVGVISLGCITQYYSLRYFNDRSPNLFEQLLPPSFFATMAATGLIQRHCAKRFTKRSK